MKKILGIVFAVVIALGVSGCSSESKKDESKSYNISEPTKIFSVSDYAYTLDGKPAVSIMFGSSETKYVNLTILKQNLKEGAVIDSTKGTVSKKISISFSLEGVSFLLHGKVPASYVKLKIESIDQTKQEAIIAIDAKLFTANGESSVNIKDKIVLSGENFINLMKQI
jgi:hypothetical protein